MWYLIQASTMFAVMASNIHWQWTPNGYLAGILGYVAALLATVELSYLVQHLIRSGSGLPLCHVGWLM
jgi:hypothetical protein